MCGGGLKHSEPGAYSQRPVLFDRPERVTALRMPVVRDRPFLAVGHSDTRPSVAP